MQKNKCITNNSQAYSYAHNTRDISVHIKVFCMYLLMTSSVCPVMHLHPRGPISLQRANVIKPADLSSIIWLNMAIPMTTLFSIGDSNETSIQYFFVKCLFKFVIIRLRIRKYHLIDHKKTVLTHHYSGNVLSQSIQC